LKLRIIYFCGICTSFYYTVSVVRNKGVMRITEPENRPYGRIYMSFPRWLEQDLGIRVSGQACNSVPFFW